MRQNHFDLVHNFSRNGAKTILKWRVFFRQYAQREDHNTSARFFTEPALLRGRADL